MYNWMFASTGGRKKRRNGSGSTVVVATSLDVSRFGRWDGAVHITAAVEGCGACVVCVCVCVHVLYGP